MYIPKGILAYFCLIGAVAANILGFATAVLSLRRFPGAKASSYGVIITYGLPIWTSLGIAVGISLAYSALTSRDSYFFDKLGFRYIGKNLFFVIGVAASACFLIYRFLAKPDTFEVRAFIICFVLSLLFAGILPITIQNSFLWFKRFPDWLSRHRPSKARRIAHWSLPGVWMASMSFSADGATLVSSGDDGQVRFWDCKGTPSRDSLPIEARSGGGKSRTYSATSPDGSRLATATSHSVKMWDYHSLEMKWEHLDSGFSPKSIVFSNDGQWLACGSSEYGQLGSRDKVSWYNATTGHFIRSEYAKYEVSDVATTEGQAGASKLDEEYRVKEMHQNQGEVPCDVRCVAFSPDDKEVCYVGGNTTYHNKQIDGVGVIGAFDRDSYSWFAPSYSVEINAITSSPRGDSCAIAFVQGPVLIASDVLSLCSIEKCKQLLGHRGGAHSLRFSADGKLLAGAFGDGTVRIWDTVSGALKATLVVQLSKKKITQAVVVAFSPDSLYLSAGNIDGDFFVWDIRDIRN